MTAHSFISLHRNCRRFLAATHHAAILNNYSHDLQVSHFTVERGPQDSHFGDAMSCTGGILGYARVSTVDQDLSSQKDRLIQSGAVRVIEDVISGKTFNRPGLAALLDHARPNDTVAVIRLDRLGRWL